VSALGKDVVAGTLNALEGTLNAVDGTLNGFE
jgi:hypothetical protein